jgi:hypothetical protein
MEQWTFAQVQERVDNKIIRKMKIKQQIKRMVQDGFMCGTAIGKLGFGALHTPTPNQLAFGNSDPIVNSRERVEYHSRVIPNMPWFMRTKPGSFIVPSQCESLDSARWVAEWVQRDIEDVKDDPRFKHVKNLSPSSRTSIVEQGKTNMSYDFKRSIELLDMLEIRDKKTGKVFVLAPFSTDKVLLFEDDAFQVTGGLNYYDLVFNQDDEWFWGVPDANILEPQQLEANEIRTQMMKHRRVSLVKILAKRGAIKDEEAEKLVSEDVLPVVNVDSEISDIHVMDGIDIPDALFKMENVNVQDIREEMGFSRAEFGETSPPNARTSAYESRVVKAASEIRVDERRDMVADMIVDMISDMHVLLHSEWSPEQVIDVIGPLGMRVWVQFNPQMLRSGAFDVSVDPDTSIPETKEVRQQKAIAIYQIFKDDPVIDQVRLKKYLMHELNQIQLDDMMVAPEMGSISNPISMGQLIQMNQMMASKAPKLLSAMRSRQVGASE